jgi:hypothetical protein
MKFSAASVAIALMCLVAFGCNEDTEADGPPKSDARLVADGCYAARTRLQEGIARSSSKYLSDDLYIIAWVNEYC